MFLLHIVVVFLSNGHNSYLRGKLIKSFDLGGKITQKEAQLLSN